MSIWRFIAVCRLAALIGLVVTPVILEDLLPYKSEVMGILGDEAHWYWDIHYVPGGRSASLRLQMDNMGGRSQTAYRIESS